MSDAAPSVDRDDRDLLAIQKVRAEILRRIPKDQKPGQFFGGLVRRAIDEVLTLQTLRFRIDQLAPPEQTYIGTRVEVLVRDALDVGIGRRADALIAGEETDLKWSRSRGWMIGPENLGTVCLGMGTDKKGESLSVGLFVPHADHLRSQNRDKKYTASATYRRLHVTWLVDEFPQEQNFIASLSSKIREDVMSRGSAQERMKRLAELVPNVAIPRSALRFVSHNKDDFMRRVREDRSRANPPLGEMISLSGKYKKAELEALGLSANNNEVVFVRRDRVARNRD